MAELWENRLVEEAGLPSSLNSLEVRCVRSAFNQLRYGEAAGNLP